MKNKLTEDVDIQHILQCKIVSSRVIMYKHEQ